MRISLPRKILIIYSTFLVFFCVQGLLLFSVINRFESHERDSEQVKEFRSLVHALNEHNLRNIHNDEKDHDPFEEQFRKAKLILAGLESSDHGVMRRYRAQFENARTYLDNYRRAYFELDALIHKTRELHTEGIRVFAGLGQKLSALDPALVEKLFLLLIDHYSIVEDAVHSQDISLLPKLKNLNNEIALRTQDEPIALVMREIIAITEASYLNSLAILDRQEFLEESDAHLIAFSDEIAASLGRNIEQYQARLKGFMSALVAGMVFLTAVLFLMSRRYFNRFLRSQEAAITAIEKGNYQYALPSDLPADELGDLAVFMKRMAGSLQESEKKIRRSEERIRLLLNSAAEAIYGLDVEGKCTFCNNSFLKLMGYDSEEELLGKNIHDLIHHTKVDGSDYPWDECVAHRGFLEGRLTHSDNEMFWRRDGVGFYVECWSHPIIENGRVTGSVVTFLDITKRREALQALRSSEELYRSLIENIDLGITLIDRDHTVVMTNAAQGRFFGHDPLYFQGKKCFREFEKRKEICEHCPGIPAMETGTVRETFAQGLRDDGAPLSVRIKAFPVFADGGEVGGFIEVVEDVTEKIEAEQNLAKEKEQLAVTLRSIGDGVITTDVEGRVVLLNKVAEQLCGWSQEEARGRPLSEVFRIINEVTGEPCENPVEKVLATGQTVALANHTALIARNGTQRSIADSGAAIRNRESVIVGVVLVFRDVTEENIRNKELLKIKKLESIGVLAGGIAHDFNNILSAIMGNINLVRHIVSPNETKAHTFLEEAEKASHRAQNLTHQLLTFSKGGEPVKQAASLEEIIRDSTGFVLRGTDIKYEFDIPADLWPVEVDRGQISQVVQNIVLNSRHAMPGGGSLGIKCRNVPPEVEKPIMLEKGRKFVMVCIRDNGIGIPAKVIDNIFDPYFTTKTDGSGLGLSICHSIINRHHGYISVDSVQGVGTTFTFHLPASDGEVVKHEAAHQEEIYAKENLTVLVMDDDEQIRVIAQAMLSHLGCRTLQAVDGREAVELYKVRLEKGEKPDVVIMDLTIPGGMGGKEAVSEIRSLDPEARVIVSSGYSNDPVMANHREHGFCAAVVKPYQLKDLAAAIDRAMAS